MNAQSYRRYIEIWERHREEIWRFIQSRLRNSSEQEDILQEVFLALYQKAGLRRRNPKRPRLALQNRS